MSRTLHRRQILIGAGATGGGIALSACWPTWAQPVSAGVAASLPALSGVEIALRIARQTMMIDGQPSPAIGINGTVPAPLIRLREGQRVRLRVANDLSEDSSIHWHGLLVPFQFDGVPGISFAGIAPGETF
ncbi:MAG: copper-binding protein, partial [Xanthobacter sp. 35-67-6]